MYMYTDYKCYFCNQQQTPKTHVIAFFYKTLVDSLFGGNLNLAIFAIKEKIAKIKDREVYHYAKKGHSSMVCFYLAK